MTSRKPAPPPSSTFRDRLEKAISRLLRDGAPTRHKAIATFADKADVSPASVIRWLAGLEPIEVARRSAEAVFATLGV